MEIEGDMAETTAGRRGIQSVEIGFRVLSAVASAEGAVSLSVLAARTGLSPSQTHRYLQSLIATGLVVQHPQSGHYDLGPASRRIGIAALSRFDSFALADQIIPDLVAKIRWTVLLAVWGATGPTLVRWYMGRPTVITNLGIGSILPLYNSATGRTFIAFASENELAELLHVEEEERRVLCPGADSASIRFEGRMKMCVHLDGRFIPGLRAISAPVFDFQGRMAFAVTAIANVAFPAEDDEGVAEALKAACRQITEDSGGRWLG